MLTLERADGSRRVGLLSLLGLLLVPLVLAGGFLAATWGSTDRLDRVQAAIVNLDEPVTLQVDGKKQTVPLGRQLAGGLVNGGTGGATGGTGSDTNFSWVLTDATDASDGLAAGRYAAVVTVPKDFSARATSYTDQSGDDAEQAVLDVQTSSVSGVSDPVVGQAITAAATRALNTQLTEQYVQNVYVGFNTTKKQFTKVADAAGQLSDGTTQLADGLEKTSDGTRELSDGLGQLDDGGDQLASGAKQLSSGLDQYADGVGTLADKTAALPKGGRQLAKGAQEAADGTDRLADGSAAFAKGLAGLPGVFGTLAKDPPKVDTPTIPAADVECPAGLELSEAQCAAFQGAVQQAGEQGFGAGFQAGFGGGYQGGLTTAATVLKTPQNPKKPLSSSNPSLITSAKALAAGQRQAADGLQKLADGTDQLADGLTPLAAGIKQLDTGASKLASGASGLSTGIAQYTGGVHGVATGAEQLSTGLVKLSGGADELADGTKQLADGLKDGAEQIPTYDKTARERLSTVVAAPVTTPEVTSVFSDVATTTLLAVLALWVGGLASFLVLRAVSAKALSSMRSSVRLTLESLLPAAVVAAVQGVLLTVVMNQLLDLSAGATVRLLGLSLLAGVTFAALNQALVAWFGGVGRFVSLVLVVLTAAAALTSAVPHVFDTVVPLLPLTPALQGIRAVATSSSAGGQAALLLAWLVVGLAAAVLATARRRTISSAALVPALR